MITFMLLKQQQDITHVLTSDVDSVFVKLGYFGVFLKNWFFAKPKNCFFEKPLIGCSMKQNYICYNRNMLIAFSFNIVHAQTKFIAMTLSITRRQQISLQMAVVFTKCSSEFPLGILTSFFDKYNLIGLYTYITIFKTVFNFKCSIREFLMVNVLCIVKPFSFQSDKICIFHL